MSILRKCLQLCGFYFIVIVPNAGDNPDPKVWK